MKMMIKLAAVAAIAFSAHSANAVTCIGTCGTLAPNGVVTAPPSGGSIQYVSTAGGVAGAGQIAGAGGTNGSQLTTDVFTAAVGDPLNFFFNYVTSDGSSSFPDYAFAELLDGANASVGFLFTARTVPSGNTSPGSGLPVNISTLAPATSAIQSGTTWSALGSWSGSCFSAGCGNTGWIQSTYNIATAGSYKIRFGTTNFGDQIYDSGLAFSGITIKGEPVPTGAVPEPAAWMMMLLGMGAIGYSLRRKKPAVLAQLA